LYGLTQQYETFFRDRLIANDFIQVRKVAEHVYEKVLGAGSESGSVAGPSSPGTERTDPERQETGSIAEDRVELLCNDQVLFSSSKLAYLEEFLPCFNNMIHNLFGIYYVPSIELAVLSLNQNGKDILKM
jgi:hypothetical protein